MRGAPVVENDSSGQWDPKVEPATDLLFPIGTLAPRRHLLWSGVCVGLRGRSGQEAAEHRMVLLT
jgi:hypothetical protein